MMAKNRIPLNRGDRVFHTVNTVIMGLICIVILYPLYYVIIASVTDPTGIRGGELLLYPRGLYFDGYMTAFRFKPLITGYRNSIIYTLLGTAINIAATIPGAYALSRKDLAGRNGIMLFMSFTMFFNGGMIPLYMLIRNLRLMDTVWSLVLPGGVSVFNLIVVRTFYQSNIPDGILEAAKIDGCSDIRFFFRIVLPLSSTIVAVMIVFYAVNHWNAYFNAIMYLNTRSKMPLQAILRDLLIENTITVDMRVNPAEAVEKMKRADQLKYCVIVLASFPVMVLYPMAQKYFAQGVMIGSIKE
jgi:putative aldouronate transport system permease protein